MKIQVEVEIFDDPEYCDNVNKTKKCNYLSEIDYDVCTLFKIPSEQDTNLKFDYDKVAFRKCPQCKEAYQKAQSKQVNEDAPEAKLYHLIDNIDTAFDMYKPDMGMFEQYVAQQIEKAHEIIHSKDGQTLEYNREFNLNEVANG